MLAQIAREVAALPDPYVAQVAAVMADARRELVRDLQRWLKRVPDGEERFTAQRYREALLQLEVGLQAIGARAPAEVMGVLGEQGDAAAALAIKHLKKQVLLHAQDFGGELRALPARTAAMVERGAALLLPRYQSSIARYGSDGIEAIKRQLAIGVMRGETFEEMTRRLMRDVGGQVMRAGWPLAAAAESIGTGFEQRLRSAAERIVRTEGINAYNDLEERGLMDLEAEDPGWLKRWDASADNRTCPICGALDQKTAQVGGVYPGGYVHPPAHPRCRCCQHGYRPEWDEPAPPRAAKKAEPAPKPAAAAPAKPKPTAPKPQPPKPAAPAQPQPSTADARRQARAEAAAAKARARAEAERQAAIAAQVKADAEAAAEKAAAAKAEAEARAAAEREAARVKAEQERLAAEAKKRAEAEAAAKAKAEQERKAAEEAAKKAAAEAKERERLEREKAKAEAERRRAETAERARRSAEEARAKAAQGKKRAPGAARARIAADIIKDSHWREENGMHKAYFGGAEQAVVSTGAGDAWRVMWTGRPEPGQWSFRQFATREEAVAAVRERFEAKAARAAEMISDEKQSEKSIREAMERGDGADIRRRIRAVLHDHGVLPRDPMLEPDGAGILSETIDKQGYGGLHHANGKVEVTRGALAKFAKDDVHDGIATLIHEEIHGSRPALPSFGPVGIALEEATTETAALRITRKFIGPGTKFRTAAYVKVIDQLERIVREEGGIGPGDLKRIIGDASIAMRAPGALDAVGGKPLRSGDDLAGLFVAHLDVAPEARQKIRDRIIKELRL